MTTTARRAAIAACLIVASPGVATAQNAPTRDQEIEQLRAELAVARAQLDSKERRLRALEGAQASAAVAAPAPADQVAQVGQPRSAGVTGPREAAIERVGEMPLTPEMPMINVLGGDGGVITRRGQLTGELSLEYARADRNRALFRGIEIVESVLIGVFDINESRQDVLTAAGALRYGVSNRFEIGARLPFVRRSDTSVLAPIAGSTPNDAAATRDNSARGTGIGDAEFSLRYQLNTPAPGRPFFIGNVQVVAPTGTSPFDVPRDATGIAQEAAMGAGFWAISPSITAIVPSDPAVLFGTLGYTRNFADTVDTVIGPTRIVRVKPGDSVSASVGLGLAVNQRTSFNLGYAHTWGFGTTTRTALLTPPAGSDGISEQRSRDLQIGRLLFGVTHRVSNAASINWTVEVGATDDATDLRTVIRIPLVLLTGR